MLLFHDICDKRREPGPRGGTSSGLGFGGRCRSGPRLDPLVEDDRMMDTTIDDLGGVAIDVVYFGPRSFRDRCGRTLKFSSGGGRC